MFSLAQRRRARKKTTRILEDASKLSSCLEIYGNYSNILEVERREKRIRYDRVQEQAVGL